MKRRKLITQKELGYILIVVLVVSGGGITYNNFVKVENIKLDTTSAYIDKVNTINDLSKQSKRIKINEQQTTENTVKVKEKPEYNIPLAKEYSDLIWKFCDKNNISYELALAVMYQESKFDFNMININSNGTHDGGLYQINSSSIKDYRDYAIQYCDLDKNAKPNVLDPQDNIRLGIGGLVHLINYYQEKGVDDENLLYFVLGSYNRGKGGYNSYVSRNGYVETSYANQVLYYKTKLEQKGTFD